MEFRKVEEGDTVPKPAAADLVRPDVEAMSKMADRMRADNQALDELVAVHPGRVSKDDLVRRTPPWNAEPGIIRVTVPREVRLARYLWAAEYHASGLGMLDWWLSLDQGRKDFAGAALRSIMD